jgi:ADP-heptose:LPS heptosyltransferase
MLKAPPRILVIKRRYLGDIVLLGLFFRSLRRHWPDAIIDVLVEEQYAEILTLNPDVNGTQKLPKSPKALGRWFSLLRTLRAQRYTHVLDLDNTEKTACLTRVTGAPLRAALHLRDQRVRFPFFYTHQEAVESGFRRLNHITAYYNRLLGTIGVTEDKSPLQLQPRPDDLTWARSLPALTALPNDRPKLLLHPGSRSAFRVWPAENFATVCDQLQRDGIASVTLIAGPAEQVVVTAIRERMQTPVTVINEQVSIARLAALFKSFDLLLCHDSGPMHLATAVGLPVVALFSSQNINEWRPLGAGNIALQPPLPCVNCVAPGVCKPDNSYQNYCVRNITTERVLTAIRERLVRASPA